MDKKKCSHCKQEKPFSDFHKNRSRKDGLTHACKICCKTASKKYRKKNPGLHKKREQQIREWEKNNPEKVAQYRRNQRKKNPQRTKELDRKHNIKWKWGLTVKEYDTIINKGCAICGYKSKNTRELHLDHDHKNGKIREALCSKCNTALGLFKEDSGRISNAIKYLEKHKQVD